MSTTPSRNARRLVAAGVALAALAPVGVAAAGDDHLDEPQLEGRAVLPVETYAHGPASGAGLVTPTTDPDGDGIAVINGIQFPTPSQPVEGFSGIVEGRARGEWLAMADNGFGNKANSRDFNIRAYYVKPDFKTADGGDGDVKVRHWIEFSDPRGVIGFPIVNEGTNKRVLTGGDIDPESIQRGSDGTFWIGDEFGPWILHFDERGRLMEKPYALPDGLFSPANPLFPPQPPPPAPQTNTVNSSRGIEAMAMTPDGRSLFVVLEGAVVGDAAKSRRVYEFDTGAQAFVPGHLTYMVEPGATGDTNLVSDAQAVDRDHLLVMERDAGRGTAATYRKVWLVDLRGATPNQPLPKVEVVDLAAIPDPDLVSLPAIHTGDVGLGDPFRVTCESIEALRIIDRHHLLFGCDNNFPNTGRNPNLADDNEFITVRIP
jgi:glycerophosphoryl diester phosphodiesterase